MNKLFHILILSFLMTVHSWGQKIVPTPQDLYLDAMEFMYSGDYHDAVLILITLKDKGYNTANINYKIGECYLNIAGQKTNSIPYLSQAERNLSVLYDGTTLQEEFAPNKTLLYLGIAYRLQYDFDKALAYFNDYLRTLDDSDKDNIRLTEYHMERCNYAREMIAAPALFTSDTLAPGINTNQSNFNPLLTSDEKVLLYMNQLKFYDAVEYAVRIDSEWSAPENLTPLIKSDGDHYTTGLSADATGLFLTSYDPYKTGEIFTAFRNGTEWTEMQKLKSPVNSIFNETHASPSPDGKVLYFTSDRKGGYGGLDIYRAFKNSQGEWDHVSNLGPLINTPYNEESPFVSSDGKRLFFSSQGHYNMGGYDVFYSSIDSAGNWLPPVNIGYPLNTTDDDLFFFPVGSGNIAYQSRFSTASSQMDIIRFVIHAFGKPARFALNGKMNLHADPEFLPSDIRVDFISRTDSDTLATTHLNEEGSFRQKLPAGSYKLDFSDNTRLLLSRELDIPDYFPHNNLVFQDAITVPSLRTGDTLYLKNIYFDFNLSMPPAEYQAYMDELISVMLKYPEITMQISGYADARGTENYNLKLSRLRAEHIKDYFLNKIEQQRIITQGFGEDHPIARNNNADGSDNPEGRKYNRRAAIDLKNTPDTVILLKVDDVPLTLQK